MRFAYKLVGKVGVVLLQHALGVRVGVGQADGRVRLARLAVRLVVDARDAHAERDGEGGALRGHGHLVENHRLQVTLVLGRAAEVEELLLRSRPHNRRSARSVRARAGVGVGGQALSVSR